MPSKSRFGWMIALFLALFAAIVGFNAATTAGERNTALLINVAARQRALAERYIKDVLLKVEGFAADPDEDATMLRGTAQALLEGGEVQAVQGADATVRIQPIRGDWRSTVKLQQERDLISKLLETGDALMATPPTSPDFEEQLLQLRITGAQVSSVTNDAVGEMTRHSQASFLRLVWVGVALGLVGALAAIAMALLLRRAGARQATHFRALVQQTVQATELERKRVAAELHDGPVQHLTAFDLKLESLRGRIATSDSAGSDQLVDQLQDRLRKEIAELRRTMTGLRPPMLDERGLPAALREHLSAIGGDAGFECELEADLGGRLDPAHEVILYRVAQEAIANVKKHARAKHAWVSLQETEGRVVLMVKDDGVGFDPAGVSESARNGHFGLLGMRERVEMAGGTWAVHASHGSGTMIRADLPTSTRAA